MGRVAEKDTKMGSVADKRKVNLGLMDRQKSPKSKRKSGRKHGAKIGRY